MSEKFFADTNVAVYALEVDEQKRRLALAIMRRHPVISTEVVNEFINVLLGKRKLDRAKASRLALVLMRHCDVVSVTPEITEQAMALGERYQIGHWDAVIGSGFRRAFDGKKPISSRTIVLGAPSTTVNMFWR